MWMAISFCAAVCLSVIVSLYLCPAGRWLNWGRVAPGPVQGGKRKTGRRVGEDGGPLLPWLSWLGCVNKKTENVF